jgi:hypothetical protein
VVTGERVRSVATDLVVVVLMEVKVVRLAPGHCCDEMRQ